MVEVLAGDLEQVDDAGLQRVQLGGSEVVELLGQFSDAGAFEAGVVGQHGSFGAQCAQQGLCKARRGSLSPRGRDSCLGRLGA